MWSFGSSRKDTLYLFAAAASCTLLYATAMFGLWHMPSTLWGMYANSDGAWAAWNARSIIKWGVPFDLSPFNPLAGTGSLFLPNLPWLNPGAMALALPGPVEIGYGASYTIYFFELLIANYFLFRALGADRWTGFFASQAYVLILFPPSSILFGGLPWYSLAPVNAHLLALCNALLVVMIRIGQAKAVVNVVLAVALVGLALAAFTSAPLTIITYVPAYAVVFVCLLFHASPVRRELIWKAGAISIVFVLFWGLGIFDFIRATGAVSSRFAALPGFFHRGPEYFTMAYWSEIILPRYSVCSYPQYLYLACYRMPVGWVLFAGLFGALVAIWTRSRLAPVGWSVIGFIVFVHILYGAEHDAIFGGLHALGPPFALWPFYPFCILAAAFGIAHLVNRSGIPTILRQTLVIVSIFMAPAVALSGWILVVAPNQPPLSGTSLGLLGLPKSNLRPPPQGPIMARLRAEAAISVGSKFAGYTATYFGDDRGWIKARVPVLPKRHGIEFYPNSRLYLEGMFKNTFQEMDLWEVGIPTIEEYGQWVTIFMWTLGLELFAAPDQRNHPSFVHIHRIDIPSLRKLGARFLISDMEFGEPGTTLLERETSPAAPGPIYLYRIDGPTIGEYAIVDAEVVSDFNQALRRIPTLADTRVVTFEPIPFPLARPEQVDVRYRRDGFSVTARADGLSGLVLPFQFSRCLTVKPRIGSSAASVRLLRANAVQTLALFDRDIDVDVKFEFGPLNAACRSRDGDDVRALGLQDAAVGRSGL